MPPYQLIIALLLSFLPWSPVAAGPATEFCLDGELDLGARYQGLSTETGEFYPTTWCVVTEADSNRVWFAGSGKANPDMDGDWTVVYLPPDTVRIVNSRDPPDIEFNNTDNLAEALSVRRLDPHCLLQEFRETPENLRDLQIRIADDKIQSVATTADLPLRGRVDVVWHWDWTRPDRPAVRLVVDNTLLLKATGRWTDVSAERAETLWQPTPGAEPVQVPGNRWPASIDLQHESLAPNVSIVTGARTGFQHLVVDTDEGLVIADAPAGWMEFHQIPPTDLVPGLGISGLSERFVDYLGEQFPERPIRAVILTHAHDDHVGGARAFAAAGAEIFAPRKSARFLETALNRQSMPTDRASMLNRQFRVTPVNGQITLGSKPARVRAMSTGAGPHADAMLGVWAMDQDYFFVSDVHVPRSNAETPRKDRAVTECWFADWAVRNLPPETRVINSHSSLVTPVSRLRRYLDSELCKVKESTTVPIANPL